MATKRYQRDFKELELRRRKGMRMLARGVPQAEVARALAVRRQTTSTWAKKLAADPHAWRRRPLSDHLPETWRGGSLLVSGGVTFNPEGTSLIAQPCV